MLTTKCENFAMTSLEVLWNYIDLSIISNCIKIFLAFQNNFLPLSCSLTLLKCINWFEKIIKKICIFSSLSSFINEIPIFLSIIDGWISIKIIYSNQKSMINKYIFKKRHKIIISNIQNCQSKKYKIPSMTIPLKNIIKNLTVEYYFFLHKEIESNWRLSCSKVAQ